jgi:hypothetical protein
MLNPGRRIFVFTIVILAVIASFSSFNNYNPPPDFIGEKGDAKRFWLYPIDARQPCWLRLKREERPVIRVNCFALDGVLYTHSNRFVAVANLLSKSWTQTVEQHPELEVLIEDKIYLLRAVRTASEDRRKHILAARHYVYIPDGIQVYALQSRMN